LTAAVERNELVLDERGLIFCGYAIRMRQNVEFRGIDSQEACSFGEQHRPKCLQIGRTKCFHDTGNRCTASAKPDRGSQHPTSPEVGDRHGCAAENRRLSIPAERLELLKKTSVARFGTIA
jgi:hypothetical protein